MRWNNKVEVGQLFRKTDRSSMIFQVVALVSGQGFPHARLVQLDNPSVVRVIALATLSDKRHFVPADAAAVERRARGELLRPAER